MIRNQIRIILDDSGNVQLIHKEKTVTISITEKQIKTADIYKMLDYSKNKKYELIGDEKFSEEKTSGPKNEKFRLYNYVHEYIDGLIKEINKIKLEEESQ